MEKRKWGWKLKYVILFIWIFLFSCKAHQTESKEAQRADEAVATTSSHLWKWIYAGTFQ